MSKQYATNDNGNDLLAEDGIEDTDSAANGKNIEDGSGIDTEEVIVGESVTTINIIIGAVVRENTNPSVYLASHKHLNDFIHSFIAEFKEQVKTKDKHVRIANVRTFYQDENRHLTITHQPYPPN